MMLEELLTGRNISLAGGIFVVTWAIKGFLFPEFWKGRLGQRFLPLLPLALGLAGAFCGVCDCAVWQDKLLIGLIAGWASSNVFKIGRTSIMGYGLPDADGDGIPDSPVPAPPGPRRCAARLPVVLEIPASQRIEPLFSTHCTECVDRNSSPVVYGPR